ncbi:response regulator transcription factor [Citromicrobium bathyomarinum]|uniref:LytR/AlgR family response regulator transcription factor n=1 Tax=Citromicrobium bathyomarinum TaxID=72174 RepID=UPI003159F85D
MTQPADPLSICIVDDEPLAHRRLRQLLDDVPGARIVADARDGRVVPQIVSAHRPDLLLLDIEMPHVDGFDVIEALQGTADAARPPLIIFTTAFPDFAAQAYETGAIDFLTKPVQPERLAIALDRARNALIARDALTRLELLQSRLDGLRRDRAAIAPEDPIWVSHRGDMIRVLPSEIEQITAEGEYVSLHVGDHRYLHRGVISRFLEDISDPDLVRVHRSHAVRRTCIERTSRNKWGAPLLHLSNRAIIPVGRKYLDVMKSL